MRNGWRSRMATSPFHLVPCVYLTLWFLWFLRRSSRWMRSRWIGYGEAKLSVYIRSLFSRSMKDRHEHNHDDFPRPIEFPTLHTFHAVCQIAGCLSSCLACPCFFSWGFVCLARIERPHQCLHHTTDLPKSKAKNCLLLMSAFSGKVTRNN
jgi:hypothetical protein